MTHYQITLDPETVHSLLSDREQGLGKLLEQVLNQILVAQAGEHLQADPYERTENRQGYRNGYKPRKLTTRVGTLTLRIPQLREGVFSTELFQRYQRSEQALVLALMEMVINGVSTRKIAAITEELCGTSFAKSTVSDLCRRLDPIVRGWNERDLGDRRFPFVIVDAMIIKIRTGDRVRPQSALIAIGINNTGTREILGMQIGDSESEASWSGFFQWLKQRGLTGVEFLSSDDHGGLVKAIRTHFQGVTWQRCQTHFLRNLLDACPKALQGAFHGRVKAALQAPDPKTARILVEAVINDYGDQAPKAIQRLEAGFEDATAVLVLPERYRKRLRTTNGMERLIEEVRRRERVIRIFPNQASAERLIGALLMEMDEHWSTGRRYLDMDEYHRWREQQREAKTHVGVA